MAKDVFISYYRGNDYGDDTSHDRYVADEICTALEKHGIPFFIDHKDILPGSKWSKTLLDAVEQSKIIILVVSKNTEKSEWVYDEIGLALKKKIPIIPYCIERISPKDFLRQLEVRCQWIYAYNQPSSKHFERLLKSVCMH